MNLTIDTIVVPQGAEYQAVCQGLKQARVKTVKVVSIPIGTKDILQTLVNRSFEFISPQNVLIMGLCGSLDPTYSAGDVILYQSCCNFKQKYYSLDAQLTTVIEQKIPVNLAKGLTSDRPIYLAKEKTKLGREYSANVVDMEGYGYIKEFQRQGMPVAMVRVVSDGVTKDIPDLTMVIDEEGSLDSLQMAIAFLRQPIASIGLIKGSLAGLKQLRKVTKELFSSRDYTGASHLCN